jgi:hypothetical protein
LEAGKFARSIFNGEQLVLPPDSSGTTAPAFFPSSSGQKLIWQVSICFEWKKISPSQLYRTKRCRARDRLLPKVGRCRARPANIQDSHLDDAHDPLGTIQTLKIGSVPVAAKEREQENDHVILLRD